MRYLISVVLILLCLFHCAPVLADTIDRIWFEDQASIPIADHGTGFPFPLPTHVDSYFGDNGLAWDSGAGAQRAGLHTYESLTVSGDTIRYDIAPPADGILYTHTDYGSGLDSPCAEGTLGIIGSQIIEAESGARIAFYRGNTQILSNEIDRCSSDDFYPYSANVGDTIPYEFIIIPDNGVIWDTTTFDKRWRYRVVGAFDFTSISLNADAGPDLNAWSCRDVILDGNFSTDSSNTIVQYKWDLLHRSDDSLDQTIYGINPTISNLEPGTYDVILTVSSDIDFKDADTMVLTVSSDCPPKINNIWMYKDGTPPVESYLYNEGETYFLEFEIEDADMDALSLTFEEYYPVNSPTPYTTPVKVALPPQPSETAFYTTLPSSVTGPLGEWRLVFKVEDAAGNMSEEYEMFATVETSIGTSGSQGGGGGGGGGCFISMSLDCFSHTISIY